MRPDWSFACLHGMHAALADASVHGHGCLVDLWLAGFDGCLDCALARALPAQSLLQVRQLQRHQNCSVSDQAPTMCICAINRILQIGKSMSFLLSLERAIA